MARNVVAGYPGASVRSAMTTVVADSALGPEDVLRRVIAQLGAQ